jgi:hypothetical protein
MMGIPLELVTMLGSTILGGLMSIWSQSIKAKQAEHSMALEMLKAKQKGVEAARKNDSKEFQFTRRFIAIAAVLAIIVWPKIAVVMFPEMGVTVGWTEWRPGFLFLEGKEAVVWKQLPGMVLTPLDTHVMSAIIGLYFGASVVRNAR